MLVAFGPGRRRPGILQDRAAQPVNLRNKVVVIFFYRSGTGARHGPMMLQPKSPEWSILLTRGEFYRDRGGLGGISGLNGRVLTANRRATSSMLYSAQDSMGACIMDAVTFVVVIISIYLAGRIAESRGRRFRNWAWIAAIIGPFALPLVFLFPNLHGKDGDLA
jgi:hypothetical protein